MWGSRSDTESCKNQKWICNNSKKKHRVCRQLVLCGSPCSACVGWSLMTFCVEWQFLCGLVEAEGKKKKKRQAASTRGQSDRLWRCRETAMWVCVCTQGLSRGQDISCDICCWSVGLLVLKEQIPVRRQVADLLQSMTLTIGSLLSTEDM